MSKYFLYISNINIKFPSSYILLINERRILNKYYFVLPIILDLCPLGYVLEKKFGNIACKMCEKGKYTLSMYGICNDCVDGGECDNGLLIPKPGL